MNDGVVGFLAASLFIGCGATLVMDVWTVFLKRCFGVASLDYAMVGRWVGHFPRGKFTHNPIGQSAPIRGEGAIGWFVHYAIGVVFAGILLAIGGVEWVHNPTLTLPLIVGLCAVVAPFFIMQPCLGFGMAARKAPKPHIARLRSVVTHTVFGVGLYLSALVMGVFV